MFVTLQANFVTSEAITDNQAVCFSLKRGMCKLIFDFQLISLSLRLQSSKKITG
jgi:hypothetical protein